MSYSCIKCGLSMDLEKKKYYICPSCGSYMFEEDIVEKITQKMKEQEGKLSDEEIQKIIDSEKILLDKAGNDFLKKFKEYILAMYKMLKDPAASPMNKVVAAIALLYIINPLDIIPDFLPVIGYLDDVAMILIAVGMIGGALKKYIDKKNDFTFDNTILYAVYENQSNIDKKYTEKDGIRVLSLTPGEMPKYNLKAINSKIIKPNMFYISHPYFYKELIPVESFDQTVMDSIFEEEMSLFAALGAKRIEYIRHDVKSDSLDVQVDFGIFKKIAQGKLDFGKYTQNKITKVREFNSCDVYNINRFKDLVWYFTGDNNFSSIIQDRIFNDLSRDELTFQNDTGKYLNFKARANISKYVVGSVVKIGSNVFSSISISVEYYPRPDEVRNDPDKYYENIKEILDKRRLDLENRYEH